MKVADLIAELQKFPQDMEVSTAVGWAADTAISDKGEDLKLCRGVDSRLIIQGWLSNCGTELQMGSEEEDDSDTAWGRAKNAATENLDD